MTVQSAIEQEVVSIISDFSPLGKTEKRQSYLNRIVRAANDSFEEDDELWDKLSEDAQAWLNASFTSMSEKSDVPEPPDSAPENGADPDGEVEVAAEKDSNDDGKPAKKAKTKTKGSKKKKAATERKKKDVDKFGLQVGTKSSQAAAMFEEGAKMADVKKATGITHYNLLQRLQKQGHVFESSKDHVITLTCRDSEED